LHINTNSIYLAKSELQLK